MKKFYSPHSQIRVKSDPTCPLYREKEETALHLLGGCSTLLIWITLIGKHMLAFILEAC